MSCLANDNEFNRGTVTFVCNREVVVKALGFLAFLLPYVRKNLLLAGYVGNGFCKQTFGITTVTVPLFYFLWHAKK